MSYAIPIAAERRLVLFPHGQSTDPRHRDRCAELAFWCGGDVGRFIDAPVQTLDAFTKYLGRVRGVQGEQTLVVLTRTNPLALTVVDARRRLEASFPSLRRARWMIFLDRTSDPFFEAMAVRLGHLTGEVEDAPVWIGPQDTPYLVVESGLGDRQVVETAVQDLDELVLAESGEWLRS